MNVRELLPIGSVVLLKNAEKKLMITGILQIDNESEQQYDYIAVPYPEGNMGQENQFLFNRDKIEHIFFMGYNNDERSIFIERLGEYYVENEEGEN